MKRINYDFSEFYNAFRTMKELGKANNATLRTLKNELNRFFKDSKCKEVIYTNNTDKMFFGMKTIAVINADNIYDYLIEEEPPRISEYIVEIDSHLLDPVLDLSIGELTAILMHEVGHLVADNQPMILARNALDAYLVSNKDYLKLSDSIHYREILAYGLKDYLSKNGSMFYTNDASEIYADEFAEAYGFRDDLDSAYKKITSNNMKLYQDSEVSKFVTFAWTLSLYRNLRVRRIGAIKTLTRAKLLTGSRIEKMEIENVLRRIGRIDDDALLENVIDNTRAKLKAKMRKHRLNNLRTIDSTFFELNMQVRNVTDEEDALYLMRQINTNMSIIDEYRNSKDCDDAERKQWDNVMTKFQELRDKLSATVTYKNKTYGVFVNYPTIVEDNY